MLEKANNRHLQFQLFAQTCMEPYHQEGMSAKFEEVILDTHLLQMKYLLPDPAYDPFHLRLRWRIVL